MRASRPRPGVGWTSRRREGSGVESGFGDVGSGRLEMSGSGTLGKEGSVGRGDGCGFAVVDTRADIV